jgi:hypothetical protein
MVVIKLYFFKSYLAGVCGFVKTQTGKGEKGKSLSSFYVMCVFCCVFEYGEKRCKIEHVLHF